MQSYDLEWATTKAEICKEYQDAVEDPVEAAEKDVFTFDELESKYLTRDTGFFCDWKIHGMDTNDFARYQAQIPTYAFLLAEARRWVFYYYNSLKAKSELEPQAEEK
ncbi:MAG: hypothetical protein KAI73_10650 [Rhodospirillaceae bacterium]|nr:hypothetical protein [Rhodospirillaceae bacterium]